MMNQNKGEEPTAHKDQSQCQCECLEVLSEQGSEDVIRLPCGKIHELDQQVPKTQATGTSVRNAVTKWSVLGWLPQI